MTIFLDALRLAGRSLLWIYQAILWAWVIAFVGLFWGVLARYRRR